MKGMGINMTNSVSNSIELFSSQLRELLGNKISKIILYGSYARGDYKKNSDVDVMILVTMPDSEIKKIENEIYDLAFDIEMDTGVDIFPIIKNEEHYMYWVDTLPFYKNIKKEGILINGT